VSAQSWQETVNIRLLADADLNFAIVQGVRPCIPDIDFLSAAEAGLSGVSDTEVLEIAARGGRILVSHDLSTMPKHFALRASQGKSTPGVFLVSQDVVISEIIEALALICTASRATDWANQLTHLPSLARHVFQK